MREARTFLMAFLDGISFAGFLGNLRIPGSPDRLFARPEDANGGEGGRTSVDAPGSPGGNEC